MAASDTTVHDVLLWRSLPRILGLATVLGWEHVAFFSKLVHFSTRNDITHLNSTYSFASLGLALGLLTVWVLWQKRPSRVRSIDRTKVMLASAIALSVCTVILAMVEHRVFTQPWCSIFATLSGVAMGMAFLIWSNAFTEVPASRLAIEVLATFVVAAVLHVILLAIPWEAGITCATILPLVSVGCYRACSTRGADFVGIDHGADAPSDDSRLMPKRSQLARALVTIFLLGLAESFERALFMSLNPMTERMANHWILLAATLIAAVILGVAVLVFRGRRRLVYENRVIMVCMAFLFLLAPIVHGMGLASDLATMTCHFLAYMLVWSVFVRTSEERNVSVCATFAPGMGVAALGCLGGTFFGSLVTSFIELDWRLASMFALICASLVLVSFLFFFNDNIMVELTCGDVEHPTTPRRFELRCRSVAEQYGLSARETEVMTLAAKGRTTQRIQETLGISTGTVNTHLAHIYKKLDVHDRQQMLDLIDGARLG